MEEPLIITVDDGEIIYTADGGGIIYAPPPKQYNWKPKDDITAYELALAMPILAFHYLDIESPMKDLPESVCRHFEDVLPA